MKMVSSARSKQSMPELPPAKPLAYHGMNWNAQGLEQESGEFVFRALPGQLRLAKLIGSVGYAILALAVFLLMQDVMAALFAFLVGAIFLGAQRWFSIKGVVGARIDLRRRNLHIPASHFSGPRIIDFSDIRAVQYLPYKKHASFLVFAELNLITANSERLSLVHHNDLRRMRGDGEKLAEILGVPYQTHAVWRLT